MHNQIPDKTIKNDAFISEANRDLGFGSVVARESHLRFINQDGSFNVRRKGLRSFAGRNFYHLLLTIPWWQFLGVVVGLYLSINLIFAVIFVLCGENSLVETVGEPMTSHFLRAFFFSVETFGTIGYGTIAPVGTLVNSFVTVESIVSILLQALVTGMFFARFSRPTARVRFSERAVVAPYQDGTALMFRLVNMRSSQLIEVAAQVFMARFVSENGQVVRRFEQLILEREKVSFFPLGWTVVHPINEESPLNGVTHEELVNSDAEILILMTAIDEDFAQTVHTRTSFKPVEIVWNAKFVSLYNKTESDDAVSIDIRKLSKIEKV